MCQAGQPRQHHSPITRSFYTPSCRCQARGAVNLIFRIVKYLLFLITIIKQKRLFHTRSWKMSIFLIYGYEMSIAMSP
ncbi:hypothetical protein EVG59_18775 [Salmonella enterica subsp. enterica serovar Dortmund]|nr:hypothetical protein [Salmonella enterica]EBX6017772.1 hypothetical protein [Salmonella enterica subsp. enterica serovar Dortmund]ECE6342113.1 hypothetical protein [Salmonella enterica subsp. enterica]ECB1961253.1 hypothetical protein [Salmonella enterica subsp. enterica serovar Dortmund]ECG1259160.1 hypothetical protein [Salmonella enterica subsp. enterica]